MSELMALKAVGEAYGRTKELFLDDFGVSKWMKLAVVFFLTGATGIAFRVTDSADAFEKIAKRLTFTNQTLLMISLLAVGVVMIGALLLYISSVFRYVKLRCLLDRRYGIMDSFDDEADKGYGLFLFQLLISLAIIAFVTVLALAAYKLSPGLFSSPDPTTALVVMVGLFVPVIAFIVLSALFWWIVFDFAVPIDYKRGQGMVKAVEDAFHLLGSNIWEFTVFFLVNMGLAVASAVVSLFVTILLLIVLFIAAFALVFTVAFLLGLAGVIDDNTDLTASIPFLGFMVFFSTAFYAVFDLLSNILLLPINVYFNYLSLSFLSNLDPKLDLFDKKKKVKAKKKKAKKKGEKNMAKKVKVY